MAKNRGMTQIVIKDFDDLFGLTEDVTAGGEVKDIPLSELHPFRLHPFKIRSDARMEEMIASIKDNGVLVPGIARIRPEGGYEIIAGHNRKYASEQAGLTTMPMYIRNVSDADAVIMMVDSNIQREGILPSEKAWAFRMKYEAIKHQGKRGNSLRIMEESSGENSKTIQRYISLTHLNHRLLQMVDEKRIGFIPGVILSDLNGDDQDSLESFLLRNASVKVSVKKAQQIKETASMSALTEEIVKDILEAPEGDANAKKLILQDSQLRKFFPPEYSIHDMQRTIIDLLKRWKDEGGEAVE